MHYLVLDRRFPAPVYVFLDADPRLGRDDPGLPVREVTLDRLGGEGAADGVAPTAAIGGDPADGAHFQEFGSDRARDAARYARIEPRYVGPSWAFYVTTFLPRGQQPGHGRPRPFGPRQTAAATRTPPPAVRSTLPPAAPPQRATPSRPSTRS